MCVSRVCVLHTLVHHYKSENCTVVAVFLFWVPGEADILSFILETDVPQQNGDVVFLRGADKVHAIVVHTDPRLHTLNRNHCLAQLRSCIRMYTDTHTNTDNQAVKYTHMHINVHEHESLSYNLYSSYCRKHTQHTKEHITNLLMFPGCHHLPCLLSPQYLK